jgi:GTPase
MLPDYVLLAVCGVRGLGRVGREHLAVALALEVPLTGVLTKTDVAGRASVDAVVAEIR